MKKKINKKNLFNVLITWRLLKDDIKNFHKIFTKNKIKYKTFKVKQFAKEKELLKIIGNFDGLICGDDEVTEKVIDRAKKLKVISKWGTGLDSINLRYAKNNNIKVLNSPGAFTDNVSDHAIALMFSITRNIVQNHEDIKKGNWSKRLSTNLKNKTIGIIGYGKIGKMIKKKLSSFEVKFLINDLKKIKMKNTNKNTILKKSDILFLCVDLNKTSKHMISKKQFQLMKKNLVLINICRGDVIKNDDMYLALKNNKIRGAGLDVHHNEPILKGNKFLRLKNCILTSHNAFNSEDVIRKINKKTVTNLVKSLRSN